MTPAQEIHWIRKTMHVGFGEHDDVPLGTIYAWGDGPVPLGWERVTPPEVMREAVDRLLHEDPGCVCGMCPLADDCDELNHCVVDRLLKAFDTEHQILVGFRLGLRTAALFLRTMADGARKAGEEAKADQLEATAAILDQLK